MTQTHPWTTLRLHRWLIHGIIVIPSPHQESQDQEPCRLPVLKVYCMSTPSFFCWSICEAPTPIPSQGRFIPNVDHMNRMTRANSSQARPAPVAGMNLTFIYISLVRLDIFLVPSVAMLEEMAEKKAADLPVPVTQSSKFTRPIFRRRWSTDQSHQSQTVLLIEILWGRRRLSRKIWVLSLPDVRPSHFCLWYIKLTSSSKAAPSKAFLEDQAEREPAERERAEKERAKRELAKRQKLQSYEDFEPISISELDCASFF